jgi:hypothetical protein
MDAQEKKAPDLLWTCFVNWLNTLEKAFKLDSDHSKNLKEHLGIK